MTMSSYSESARRRAAGPPAQRRPATAVRRPAGQGLGQLAPPTPTVPWGPEDLMRLVALTLAGAVMIGIGWYLAAGKAQDSQQIGPMALAIGGVIVAGMGNGSWLLHGRRAVGERRRLLLVDVTAPLVARASVATPADDQLTGTEVVFELPGTERYHRLECSLLEGREPVAVSWQQALNEGRQPCGVCQP